MQWLTDGVAALAGGFWGGGELQATGMLSKATLLKFFELGMEMFGKQETKDYLKKQHEEGRDVEEVITEMQMKIFEGIGVKGEHGISCLAQVQPTFMNDREVMQAFSVFVNREAMAADEASLPPEEFAQNMAQMQQMQRQQAEMMKKMQGMSPQEQQRFMQQHLMQQMAQQEAMQKGAMGQVGAAMTEQEQIEFLQQAQGCQPAGPPAGK